MSLQASSKSRSKTSCNTVTTKSMGVTSSFNSRTLQVEPFDMAQLLLDDCDSARPACRSTFDLHREAGDQEAGRRQALQIVQLFDMAVADMASGLVAFPDQACILRLGIFVRGVDK